MQRLKNEREREPGRINVASFQANSNSLLYKSACLFTRVLFFYTLRYLQRAKYKNPSDLL